jgi:DNA-binding Lrp family transcriptional regulator
MTDQDKPKKDASGEPKVIRTVAEELNVAGNQLLERVQELIKEGNIRRLILKDANDKTLIEMPLTLGVVAGAGVALFAPVLAAVGAVAALVTHVKIVIERYEDPTDAEREEQVGPVEKSDATPKVDRLKE